MRMQRNGVAFPEKERPQAEDDDQIGNWRRYAKLHTRLLPYLEAADRTYRRTGMPIMRHLALAYPRRAAQRARGRVPVRARPAGRAGVHAGRDRRDLYLPPGNWIDFWRALRTGRSRATCGWARARAGRPAPSDTLPAPLDELPLLVRAGAVLPLLPADVDTLAPYGPGTMRCRFKRRKRLDLIVFPRGTWRGTFHGGRAARSRERRRRWDLRSAASGGAPIRSRRRSPAAAAVPALLGEPGRLRYDLKTRVLRETFSGRAGTLTVRAC